MIRLKTEKQIEGIRRSCKMLSGMYRELIPLVKPGVKTIDLDAWAQDWIKKAGARPVFLGYGGSKKLKKPPFPAALCISINEEVIHGFPSARRIKDGDLVSIDCGIDLGGFISDQALSVSCGKVSREAHALNRRTMECLYLGIAAVKPGDRLLQVSRAVEGHAASGGYTVVKEYCGHGVGLSLHEDPHVPNHPSGPNPRLKSGMVFAIEPMVNMGGCEVETLQDGWTVVTADGSLSAHWEHTVAVLHDRAEILTEPLETYVGL